MRSRYLATDYFTARSPSGTLAGFQPLSLPVPPLPSPDPILPSEILSFDLNPGFLLLPCEIGRLPIHDALAQFLSDAVPRQRDLPGEADPARSRSGVGEIEPYEGAADFEKEVKASAAREMRELESAFQFEVVETEQPWKEPASSCQSKGWIHFEVPDVKIPLDSIDIELGLTFTYPCEVAMSICSVEDIAVKFTDVQDCFLVKNGISCPRRSLAHTIRFPFFEISEIDLECEGSFSVEEAYNDLLPKIKPSHGGPTDELLINGIESLGSTAIDILENFSGYVPCKDFVEHKQISLSSVLDMDLIHLNNTVFLGKNSGIYPVNSYGDSSHLPCSVQLLEVQIFDFPSLGFSQRLGHLQTVEELEISEKMLKEDMDAAGSFYESIISSELALVDDIIKSLPAPVICDDKTLKGPSSIVGDILSRLKPHPLSAFDGIYLDWHPLLEGACNNDFCSTYKSMLEDVSGYRLNTELLATDEEIVAAEIDFLDYSPESSNMLQYDEVPMVLNEFVPKVFDLSAKTGTATCENQITKTDIERQMSNTNAEKVSFLFESMSQSNNLDYFLDVRRGIAKRSCEDETGDKASSRPSVILLENPTCASKVILQKWDIEVHQVILPDHILCLVEHIRKSYVVILENEPDSRKISSLQLVNEFELLSLPKQKLLELIIGKDERQSSGYNDEDVKVFVALYAIKQLAYFLCFFGVHTAQLYLSNLTRSLDYLTISLKPLESLIESACWKSEKRMLESHPSLTTIEEILRSNSSQNGKKPLIVAERIFWLPLTLKLTSMKMKIFEVKHPQTLAYQLDSLNASELANTTLDDLLYSDCLLASHEHVSESLPFNKLSIILEYGGSSASSRISIISPGSDDLPRLHFLKVKMENNSLTKALCEGFDVSENPKFTMEGVPQSVSSVEGRLNNQHIIQILNFVPVEEKIDCVLSEFAYQVDTSCDDESAMSTLYSRTSKKLNTPSCPAVVVIVNTQSFKKNMLISRRSSYQNILAMEKEGVQVVEREINLPMDLIFSASVCLVWYEARDFGDSTTATSDIHLFMENIATNILMLLSFAFSSCILIFEGKSSFLAAIMESSDALYAAAASLDMNLQLFCSYMPETTDEIILSCIRNATKLNTGVFPAMPESETLGESFLTKFPSINPLSAHAILSSGGTLVEYLEWSPERRIQAIGKYHIPDESISLFSTLCKFGEIGESKSVMTECSSIDSEVSNDKLQPQRKRQKFAMNSCPLDVMFDESLSIEPLNRSSNGHREGSHVSQSHQSRKTNNIDIEEKLQRRNYSIKEVLGRNRGASTSMTGNSDRNCIVECKNIDEEFDNEILAHSGTLDMMFKESLPFEPLKGLSDSLREKPQVSQSYQLRKTCNADNEKKFQNHYCSINEVLGRNRGSNTSMTSNYDKIDMVRHNYLVEEFGTEIIDRHDTFMKGKSHLIRDNSSFFQVPESLNETTARSSLPNRTLGISTRTFPTSAEINRVMNKLASSKDQNQTLEEKMLGRVAVGSNRDDSFTKDNEAYLKDNFVQQGTRNAFGISSQEKRSPLYGKNPYLNAIKSSRKQGPHRTIEFLKRMKEKSRMHEQNLPCNTCLSCPGSINNKDVLKRKSPSIIDSFRYQGGSQVNKTVKQKSRKGISAQMNSNIEKRKDTSFISSTWTPIDKRARQNLSFARHGNEKQSKLVWRSRKSPRIDSCNMKRFQGEG